MHLFSNIVFIQFSNKDYLRDSYFLVMLVSICCFDINCIFSMGFLYSFFERKILIDCILCSMMVWMLEGIVRLIALIIFGLRTCLRWGPCLEDSLYESASCFCYHYNISTHYCTPFIILFKINNKQAYYQ